MRTIISLRGVLLFGCAAGPTSKVFDVSPIVKDEAILSQFSITYRNDTRKKVCLTPNNWPNSAGKIDQASSKVWVTIKEKQYNIEEFNAGTVRSVRPG